MTVTIIILYLSAMLAAMMRPAVFFLYKSAVPTAVTSVLVAMMTTMRNAVMPSQGLSGNYHGATERDPDDCQKPYSFCEHRSLLQIVDENCDLKSERCPNKATRVRKRG